MRSSSPITPPRRIGRSSLAGLLLTVTVASASEPVREWDQAGDWSVLVDPSVGNGCFIQKDFPDGIRIRFGNVPDRAGGFISAMSQAWSDLEAGTTGTVKFLTDDAKFAGEAEIFSEDGWYGGWAFFNNPEMAVQVAKRRSLTIIGPNGRSFDVELSGTSRAMTMMDTCQAAQK